jgi:hypothetical protein
MRWYDKARRIDFFAGVTNDEVLCSRGAPFVNVKAIG